MKSKHFEQVLDEIKGLRKKVKKAAEAQEKVEHKLAKLEALVKKLYKQEQDASLILENESKKSQETGSTT